MYYVNRNLLLVVFTSWSIGAEIADQGKASLETLSYRNDHDSETIDKNVALFIQYEGSYQHATNSFIFSSFYRKDFLDQDRDVFIIEEAYFSTFFDELESFRLRLGHQIYNWSTMEVFKVVDTINSANLKSSSDKLEKHGELTLELQKIFDFGSISFYFLPKFERPIRPGKKSRRGLQQNFANPRIIDHNQIADGLWIPQLGTRLNWEGDALSLSFHSLYHIDRLAPLYGAHQYREINGPGIGGGLGTNIDDCDTCYLVEDFDAFISRPTPYHLGVFELGVSSQWPISDTIFKAEGIWKKFTAHQKILGYQQGKNGKESLSLGPDALKRRADHLHIAWGVERFFSFIEGQDTIFYLEYANIFGASSKEEKGEISIYQNDIFWGMRHNFNDTSGKEASLGITVDMERTEVFYGIKYAQRLTDQWKFQIAGEWYNAPRKKLFPTGLEPLHKDNNISFNLSRYF